MDLVCTHTVYLCGHIEIIKETLIKTQTTYIIEMAGEAGGLSELGFIVCLQERKEVFVRVPAGSQHRKSQFISWRLAANDVCVSV